MHGHPGNFLGVSLTKALALALALAWSPRLQRRVCRLAGAGANLAVSDKISNLKGEGLADPVARSRFLHGE